MSFKQHPMTRKYEIMKSNLKRAQGARLIYPHLNMERSLELQQETTRLQREAIYQMGMTGDTQNLQLKRIADSLVTIAQALQKPEGVGE